MTDKRDYKKDIIEAIKRQIKVLNSVSILILAALIFLIIRFLSLILDYISPASIVAIISIVSGLVVIGLHIANSASKNAIKKIEEYSSKLDALLNTTKDMREIVHGDVLLEKIVESSLKITEADAGSILLAEGDKIAFKIVKGSESRKLQGYSIPRSQGIIGWVIDNAGIARINKVKDDNRFDPEVDRVTGYETRSILCAPLRISSGTIGALEIVNKHNGAFTIEDEELISYFADQAAISIIIAKFYENQRNYEVRLTDLIVDVMDNHLEKRGHSKRIAKYSLIMAHAINMSEEENRKLYRASLLHDIGFLKMCPDRILSKEDYKEHSRLGYDILNQINFYSDIAPVVLYHHERYDGNGYPAGLEERAIPLASRIIAISEAFDAMISKDSYKNIGKMINENVRSVICSFQEAVEELKKNAGTQFDPELAEAFVKNVDETALEED